MLIGKGLLTAILVGAAKRVRRLTTAFQHRREAVDLLNWDDRALRDIGLTRSDVRAALDTSFAIDPTATLSQIAAGRSPNARRDSASRATRSPDPGAAGRSRPGTLPSAGPAVCYT
jgi:uncharacterized protein YjiS (DUF1127 family)